MSSLLLRRSLWIGVSVVACAFAGCGKSDADGASGGSGQNLPTAAIANPADADDDDDDDEPDDPADAEAAKVELKEGSPEWLIREAMKLRLEAPPKTEDVEELKAKRKERNERIIKLCQQAIAQVHQDPEKERLFSAAIHNLLEARLQQADSGDRDAIDALYEDAAALYKRDPKSAAAAEGAHTLVNLAYNRAKAGAGSGNNKHWLGEFARQAAHFAGNFPTEERRSLPLLFTAARSCELAGMTKEAIDTYTQIQQQFPQSQFAGPVTAVLRRLKLPGNPPQLSGATLEGDQVVLDDLVGNPVLVVFWSTETKPFLEALPTILEVTRAHAKQGLQVVGVNLDQDVAAASQFVVKQRMTWPQIVSTDPAQQGWKNPIVSYYGILEIPALWLIDASGNVVSTSVTAETLDDEVRKLLNPATTDAQSKADGKKADASTASETPRKAAKKPRAKLEEE
ncbi:MAG TPA: TlpA disulfide reductase family protein [Planctomycetaceae bacterium]|nr:TlpA disulfide reductase family protein [Planctomycetaceae bacterium]